VKMKVSQDILFVASGIWQPGLLCFKKFDKILGPFSRLDCFEMQI
jgi:hypothetical protein